MENYFMGKKQFAEYLGISLSTLERREKEMGYYLPSGGTGEGEREAFIEKMREWEKKRFEESSKKRRDEKWRDLTKFDEE